MLRSDFVKVVLGDVRALQGAHKIHDPAAPSTPFYLQDDANKRLDVLIDFLKEFNKPISFDLSGIREITDFLADQWSRIKNDASSYLAQPYSLVTRSYLLLAGYLAADSRESSYPYQHLMPTIAAANDRILSEWNKYQLQEFIIGRCDVVLFVSECLYAMGTAPVDAAVRIRGHLLDANERADLINHSKEATDFFNRLRLSKDALTRSELKAQFEEAIREDSYKISCPEELTNNFLQRLIPKLEHFLNIMQDFSPSEWPDFVKLISLQELKKKLLAGSTLQQLLNSPNLKIDQYREATLFCLLEIYKLERAAEGKYIYHLSIFNQDNKITAATNLQHAIMDYFQDSKNHSQEPLNHYIQLYCKQDMAALEEEHWITGKSKLCQLKTLACDSMGAGNLSLSCISSPSAISH